jgi:hypothetical protein
MSLAVITRPISGASNWNASGNPIIYILRRQDHTVTQINDNAGNAQIQINGVDVTSYYEVGNSVRVDTDTYESTSTVTARSFSGGNTLVTIASSYIANGTGIINNLSKRTDYKAQVELFRSSTNASLNDIVLSYSPDMIDGFINVDVSIVKNYLSAEWQSPSADYENDTEAYLKFYIKYQEYYDGAVQGSVIDDVANPIHAVFAALQIGSAYGGNMLDYFPSIAGTRKWLTKFALSSALQGLRCWRDWPFSVSFLSDGLSSSTIAIEQYDVSGAVITRSGVAGPDNNNEAISRVKIPTTTINAAAKTLKIYLKDIIDQASATDATTSGTETLNVNLLTTYPAGVYYFSGAGSANPLPTWGGPSTLTIAVRNSGSGATQVLASAGPATGGTALSASISRTPVTVAIAFDQFQFIVAPGGPGNYGYVFTGNVLGNFLSELLIDVEDVCDYNEDNEVLPIGYNPIYLFWKNSLGGDSFCMFPLYHESTYQYSTGRKAKRLTLFATDLTPVQWEAINELNSVGEVYQPAITELTSSVLATTKRVGQQVYIIDPDGNKTGVVVIPTAEKNRARNVTHSIAIEIELPDFLSV